MLKRTLTPALLLFASLLSHAANESPASKEKNNADAVSKEASSKKISGFNYTFNIDNKVNKNNSIDSVLVILDKFDHSGAGIVKKIYYPDANNQIVIEGLPTGRYYADVYVLGLYKKHFSSVIRTVKSSRKNKARLQLDYADAYHPGNASIPEENIRLFAYNKK